MKRKNSKSYAVITLLGAIPVIYIGVLLSVGLYETDNIMQAISWALDNPTSAYFIDGLTPQTVLILLIIYIVTMIYLSSKQENTRHGEEHGSSKWGDAYKVNKKLTDRSSSFVNKILSQNVSIGFDGHKHNTNLNTLVDGGSGAGKTKSVIQPNLLQCNTSFVVLDPKGESLEDNAYLLMKEGYVVKVLNLKDMSQSDFYNPFVYIKDDNDVQKVATMIMRATTPKDAKANDPYWDQQAEVLLKALMFLLFYEAPEYEQNFTFLLELLREAKVTEGQEEESSYVDELFEKLQSKNPDHIAVKYYRDYRGVPAKTLNTIQSVLKGRLEKFNLQPLARITSSDNMDITSIGLRKTALFLVIPDDDKSYNFLISILYLQMFQEWERLADSLPGKRLPVHVQVLMDEFNNVYVPDDFEQTLSVARSRGFSFTIILQNMAQLKAKYEKLWESVVGNCDTFIYLGGNEDGTHEYVSKKLGKETIVTQSYSRSYGRNGNYSTNKQTMARELMTPSEVAALNKKYSILFVKSCDPVIDLKYNVWKHPNARYTTLGTTKSKFLKTSAKILLGREKLMLDVRIATAIVNSRLNLLKTPAKAYLKRKETQHGKSKPVQLKKKNNNHHKTKAPIGIRSIPYRVLSFIGRLFRYVWNSYKKNVLEPIVGVEPYVYGGKIPDTLTTSVKLVSDKNYKESEVIDLEKTEAEMREKQQKRKDANYL